MRLEDGTRVTVLAHYYRAMVGRADIWRMRMDSTTNWAVGATAAVVSFALGTPSAPHYVVHMAALLTVTFLLLEARRLTFYHLWQRRVLKLERGLVRPALAAEAAGASEGGSLEALERELAPELGTTIPSMPLSKAIARRLRRVYLYLFAVQLLAWLLKLRIHPQPVDELSGLIAHARIGAVSGGVVVAVSVGGLLFAAVIALAMGGRVTTSSTTSGQPTGDAGVDPPSPP